MRRLKQSAMPWGMYMSMNAVTALLPAALAHELIDIVADNATALVTNNRGPARPKALDGRRLKYYVSWAPQRASIGVTITLFTYAGHEAIPPSRTSMHLIAFDCAGLHWIALDWRHHHALHVRGTRGDPACDDHWVHAECLPHQVRGHDALQRERRRELRARTRRDRISLP